MPDTKSQPRARTARPVIPNVPFCPWCASHQHAYCTGTGGAVVKNGHCACGAQRHQPTDDTAASMAVFDTPDLVHLGPAGLAATWRERDERTSR